MKPLAVILPAYNAAAYIKESVDSVLAQYFADFDLYILDDCSTDNTYEIIKSYNDPRIIYYYNEQNLGLAATLNKGLEMVIGNYEYIARMDADDWCFPERFDIQIKFLKKNRQIAMVGTQGYWLKDLKGETKSGWTYPTSPELIRLQLLFTAGFGHSSVIFRSTVLEKFDFRYNETIKTCEDWDLWVRMSEKTLLANVDAFLMKYRIVPDSNHRAQKQQELHLMERCRIIAAHYKNFGIDLSETEIFDFYYREGKTTDTEFIKQMQHFVFVFNKLHHSDIRNLPTPDRKLMGYLMARKMLQFRKNSGISSFNPKVWWNIMFSVKFIDRIRLVKSQIN